MSAHQELRRIALVDRRPTQITVGDAEIWTGVTSSGAAVLAGATDSAATGAP